MSQDGFQVTVEISNARPDWNYPLMVDDLLIKQSDGTWWKDCPGLSVGGFILTPEQEATLRPVKFTVRGLDYYIEPSRASSGAGTNA